MTADAAVKAVRRVDADGRIVVVSDEPTPPYKRPPLSKGLWKGDAEEKIGLGTETRATEVLTGRTVEDLDVKRQRALLDDGTQIGFERVLLATGARARRLPGLSGSERVVTYRTFDDYHHVRRLAERGRAAAVIGGGFIGSEMAAALTQAGVAVTLIFPENALLAARLPGSLAQNITDDYRRRGVRVLTGRTVARAEETAAGVHLTLDDGTELTADVVLVGVGTLPNDELAAKAGLKVEGGIVVDEHLRAIDAASAEALPHVFAAGDVASFDWKPLGRRLRIEHEDNAYAMGAAAGRAMAQPWAPDASAPGAAAPRPFDHLPFFYSDLFDAGYEALGLLDARLEMVEDWQEPGERGVVYYLEERRLRGVLLWNTWGQVDEARELLLAGTDFAPQDLMGRLPTDDQLDA